jgi:hypothetical protein
LSEYLTSKYASTLNTEDILHLFSIILEKYKTIKKSTEKCDINRRSYYELKNRDYIQTNTKEKILKTAYEISPHKVLDYLLKRYMDDSLEILYINLVKLYEEAIEETDINLLKQILNDYNKIKKEYESLIIDSLQQEVQDQILHLHEKAEVENINWGPIKPSLYKSNQLAMIIPLIFRELIRGEKPQILSDRFNTSIELVDALESIRKIESTINLIEYEGLIYGKTGQDTLSDYWNQLASASSTPGPYITTHRVEEQEEPQTSTAQILNIQHKGTY